MTAPSAALQRVDADIAGAQQRLAAARTFRAEVDQLRGHARSRDGGVRVSVDATGLVLALDLTDPLPNARDLQASVLATIRAAQQDVAARTSTLAKQQFGETSPVVARMAAEQEARFADRDPDGTAVTLGDAPVGRGGRWLQ